MDNTTNGFTAGSFGNATGLTSEQAIESLRRHGPNVLTPPVRMPVWRLYIEKYDDPIIRILLVAAVMSLILAFVNGDFVGAVGIFVAVFLATTVGFYFERDAARRFNMLASMDEEQPVKVLRDGRVMEIARKDVAVGDVILLETGDEVPADGRLFEAMGLEIDESSLTGEPLAHKRVVADEESHDTGGTYPEDFLLRSSMVMGGSGRMVVTAVGDDTEIGSVARKATEMTGVKTPLVCQLDRMASMISKVGTGVAVAAFCVFLGHDMLTSPLWHSSDYVGMLSVVLRYFMMAVTLIVMAVPEGLPMAVTLALALNMRRMLKTNNLVRKLHACETMGAVTVICTDKTGTLTQNRMTVTAVEGCCEVASDGQYDMLDTHMAVNVTAEMDGTRGIGNPTEVALLRHLAEKGLEYKAIRAVATVVRRLPFSTERKFMVTLADIEGRRMLFVKGAPEIVMNHCDITSQERLRVETMLAGWQAQAKRTLAFAVRQCDDISVEHLQLQAVVAISDPLRPEVPEAVRQCREAGIGVKIVTGDTTATAMEIARQMEGDSGCMTAAGEGTITGPEFAALTDEEALGIVDGLKVMSRARPADKQRLVNLLQKRGEVVAVTGDGTNDAPALNHAHVGLSLGSGTSVAKNASDMTLLDDSFCSIVRAVQWGRSLYRNIQRFIFFQLIVNVTALMLVLGGAFIGTELPLTITQMLWINLIMDTFAAMALSSLPPEDDVMSERPRRNDAFIISGPIGRGIAMVGLLFFVVMFGMLYYFEHVAGISDEELTVFFTVFVMLQWWNLLNAKTLGTTRTALAGLPADRGLLFVMAVILLGQWLIVTFGGDMFRTVPLPAATWGLIVLFTSPVFIVGELWRLALRLWHGRNRCGQENINN